MMTANRKHLLAALAMAALFGGSVLAADPSAPAPGPALGKNKAADNNNAPKPSSPAPAANDASKSQVPTSPKPVAPPAADQPKDSPVPQPPGEPKSDQPAPSATDNKQPRDADKPDQRNADRNPAGRNDRGQNPQADRDDRRRDDSAPARNPANNNDARRNAQGAIRHQTNRALSNDALSNDAANQRTGRDNVNVNAQGRTNVRGNAANLGLAFGAAAAANSPLVISSIGPRGYFANAGFQQGDQIVSVGGQRFNTQAAFYNYLGGVQVGQRIPFIILRNGQQQTVYWTPTQELVQEFAQAAPVNSANNFLGIHLDDQVNDAAVVADVDRNSPADQAGVRPDDVIVAVNGQQVSNPEDFSRAVANVSEGSPVGLNVSRMLALQIGQNAPVQQTGPVPPAPNATNVAPAQQGTVTPVPVTPAPVRRGGLFRRAR
jgi:outer membrane biosynthesis protein TonB